MSILKYILLFVLCFVVSLHNIAQPLINENIEKMANKYVKSKKNHSLVIGIINGEETEVRGFGKMSKQYAFAPNENTLFEVGSATFPFTTTLMMLESQTGKFKIEERLQKHLPDSISIPQYRPVVCIEAIVPPNLPGERPQRYIACSADLSTPTGHISFCDLALHTSGLQNSPKNYFKWSPFNRPRANDKTMKDCTKSDFYQLLSDCEVKNKPGEFYSYSNAGMALLGHSISEINQTTYPDLMQKKLLLPLGLNSSFFGVPNAQKHRLAPPHYSNGKAAENWEFDAMMPAAGLVSSGKDLLEFVHANLSTKNQAFADAFAQVQQSRIDMSERKYRRRTWGAYGWFVSTLNENTNQPVVWQNGATGGYRSFIGFVKDTKIGIVILSNSGNNVEEMGFEILEILHEK